jgi:signal transduction histidine kinase
MLPVVVGMRAATVARGSDRRGAEHSGEPAAAGRRRPSLVTTLAASLLLVALVPFLPLAAFAWWGYHEEVARIEQGIRASNRHIAVLAGHYLESLLRQVREELAVHGAASMPVLPPAVSGVRWERVAADGTVEQTQLEPDRVGRACGYAELLRDAGAEPQVSPIGPWVEGRPPTVLVHGAAGARGRMVAVLDPAALHRELQAWTPEGGDRHLYVVEGSGRLLFYSDLRLSQGSADISSNPPIGLFVDGGEGDLRYESSVSGKQRLGTVLRLADVDWGIVVSTDVGAELIGLRGRYWWFGVSILCAVGAALAILAVTTRRLVRPLLDIARVLRYPGRDPTSPLEVAPATRRLREYDELVTAFDELGSEVAAVERELVQAEKASLLGQLASGLAHEIGTPLNVITGNAEYLMRKADEADPARPALELIVRQGQRIAAMIRRLLDVSRPAEARLVPVALAPLVAQSLEIVPGLNRNVEVRTDLEPELPPVLADPKLLEHVLMNLILNACQAMPEGGRLAVVAGLETAEAEAPSVVLAVADSGCGIAAADLPRIFEPFFTTKAQGVGTGLGLPIVDRIVRQHGGGIEVTSTPGRGTVVLVRLRPAPGDLAGGGGPRESGDAGDGS